MKYLQAKIAKKLFFCMVLIILGLMSVSVTHAETYKYVTKWGFPGTEAKQFDHPRGVAVDSDGNVYIADTGNNRIQKLNSDGGYNNKWGLRGSGDVQFLHPYGVAVDSGNVYVADTENNRIQKFDKNGGYSYKWGLPGKLAGEFGYPGGVAIDSDGNVYVADIGNNRIQKFNSDGGYIFTWGLPGTKENEFNEPSGVAVDSDYNVYVADTRNNRIQKFSLFADTTISITSSPNPSKLGQSVTFTAEMSTDSSGADTPSGNVTFFNESTPLETVYLSSGQATFTAPSLPVGLHSITAKYNGATNFNKSTSNILTQKVSDLEVPVAEFSYYPAGLTVQFNDTSSGNVTSWSWEFGDEIDSDKPNPKHNYSSAGNYTVTLKVKNEDGKDAIQTKMISVSPLPINVIVSSEPESVETNKSSTITVNVTGVNGEGISGADVILGTDIGDFDLPPGITDSSGQFVSTFKSSEKGTVTITAQVTKEGFNNASNKTSIQVMDPKLENLNVSVFSGLKSIKSGESSNIIVTVTGANGEEIFGARVELTTDIGNLSRKSGSTDSSGQFISTYIASAGGKNTITAYVTKEGFNDASDDISIEVIPVTITPNDTEPSKPPVDEDKTSDDGLTLKDLIIPLVAILSIILIGVVIYTKKPKTAPEPETAPAILPVETALDVQIEPKSIPADGKSTAKVTIRIKDDKGNFIPSNDEKTVDLAITLGTVTKQVKIPSGAREGNAVVTSGETEGTAMVTASSSPLEATAKVSFVSK